MLKKRKLKKRAENIARLEAELLPEVEPPRRDPWEARRLRYEARLERHRSLYLEHIAFKLEQRGIYIPDSVAKIDPRRTAPI